MPTETDHHKPLVPPQRFQWAPLLLALVTFICGGVIGAGLYKWLAPPPEQPRPKTDEERAQRWFKEIDERLALNKDQEEKVHRFTLRFTKEYQAIRADWQDDIVRVMVEFDKQMQSVLTPQQKPKFDKYYKELLARWLPKPLSQSATQPAGN